MVDQEVDELGPRVGIGSAQASDGLRQLEDGGRQVTGGVDPDHVVRPAADQEDALESAASRPAARLKAAIAVPTPRRLAKSMNRSAAQVSIWSSDWAETMSR